MPTIEHRNDVAVLHLGDGENRFSIDYMNSIHKCLDSLSPTASGLVTTGTGKFYSNGLSQDSPEVDASRSLLSELECVLNRILTFPVPTVAAINGHAFGAGALFALAHDYRFMRSDRGYFCFPEIDIDVPFTRGMSALIQTKLSPMSAHVAMTTGRRYDASAALDAGLIDTATSNDHLLQSALSRLVPPVTGKNAETLATIKSTMYESTTTALLGNQP